MAKHDIFISYSRADKNIVSKFVEIFEKAGYKVWIDAEGIYSGARFKKVLVKAIEDSSVFIFFSSEKSNSSPWTAKEIGIAVNKMKTIIPVKIDNSKYNEEVAFDIINLDFVDYYSNDKRKREVERLMLTLSVLLNNKQKPHSLQDRKPSNVKESLQKLSLNKKGCSLVLSISVSFLVVLVYFVTLPNHEEPNLEIEKRGNIERSSSSPKLLRDENDSILYSPVFTVKKAFECIFESDYSKFCNYIVEYDPDLSMVLCQKNPHMIAARKGFVEGMFSGLSHEFRYGLNNDYHIDLSLYKEMFKETDQYLSLYNVVNGRLHLTLEPRFVITKKDNYSAKSFFKMEIQCYKNKYGGWKISLLSEEEFQKEYKNI